MSKKGNRAQAAMEFLLTYGWAILVVLVVIGALAVFGVLNPQRLLPARCSFPSGFSCNNYVVDQSDNQIKLKLGNSLGKTIVLISVSANSTQGVQGLYCNDAGAVDINIKNGESYDAALTCLGVAPGPIAPSMVDPGSKYGWDISVRYRTIDDPAPGTYAKTITGELLTSIEA